ncbi:MAG: hypothetical protein JRG95_09295, partial [Deltaproteobacteria bacterium]|nr:hypothetical protein [Deltaproteobacteria bacterium]
MKLMGLFRWTAALLMLLFGVLSHDPRSDTHWLILSICLYGLPIASQLIPITWIRVFGLYAGAFMVIQALLSAHFFP